VDGNTVAYDYLLHNSDSSSLVLNHVTCVNLLDEIHCSVTE